MFELAAASGDAGSSPHADVADNLIVVGCLCVAVCELNVERALCKCLTKLVRSLRTCASCERSGFATGVAPVCATDVLPVVLVLAALVVNVGLGGCEFGSGELAEVKLARFVHDVGYSAVVASVDNHNHVCWAGDRSSAYCSTKTLTGSIKRICRAEPCIVVTVAVLSTVVGAGASLTGTWKLWTFRSCECIGLDWASEQLLVLHVWLEHEDPVVSLLGSAGEVLSFVGQSCTVKVLRTSLERAAAIFTVVSVGVKHVIVVGDVEHRAGSDLLEIA